MWIIPSNHPLYSAFAPECLGSKEELSELSDELTSSLMWRSKPSSLPTWSQRWSRVYWLPLLFGRMLKPSTRKCFEESYRASLADIPASHSATQATGLEQTTPDTLHRIYLELSQQQDLFGAFSRTSKDTSAWDTILFTKAFGHWVTRLRAEYTQRKKLAQHTRESAFSSSPSGQMCWSTPVTAMSGMYAEDLEKSPRNSEALPTQVAKWSTPQARDYRAPDLQGSGNYQRKQELGYTIDLNSQVHNWPTPTVSDTFTNNLTSTQQKPGSMHSVSLPQAVAASWPTPTVAEAGKIPNQANYGQPGLSNHPAIVGTPQREKTIKGDSTGGQRGRANSSTTGNSQEPTSQSMPLVCSVATAKSILRAFYRGRLSKLPVMSLPAQLNPHWVSQLMGTTSERIFFVHLATGLLNKQQK